MKTALYLFALLLCSHSFAQTVPSSCNAPDSVVQKYINDADWMALQRMIQTNYVDSIEIPQSWTDTTLRALIAVYNATTLPARDSVVTLHNIHNLNTDRMNHIMLVADSMAGYMVQMKNNNMPTGFVPFDDLVAKYHLDLKIYAKVAPQFPGAHGALMVSDSNYNMDAMADSFLALPNMWDAAGAFGSVIYDDSLAITDTITPNYIALDYRYSWDCNFHCVYSHTWHFRVPYTCDSVTYIGSSGDPLPVSVKDASKLAVRIYPNPVTDKLLLDNPSGYEIRYTIYDLQGRQLRSGTAADHIDVTSLNAGLYFIHLAHQQSQAVLKFLKE